MQINFLCDNGSDGITNFVKRSMKLLMHNDLARQLNLTGQKGKRPFKLLELNKVLFGN